MVLDDDDEDPLAPSSPAIYSPVEPAEEGRWSPIFEVQEAALGVLCDSVTVWCVFVLFGVCVGMCVGIICMSVRVWVLHA